MDSLYPSMQFGFFKDCEGECIPLLDEVEEKARETMAHGDTSPAKSGVPTASTTSTTIGVFTDLQRGHFTGCGYHHNGGVLGSVDAAECTGKTARASALHFIQGGH